MRYGHLKECEGVYIVGVLCDYTVRTILHMCILCYLLGIASDSMLSVLHYTIVKYTSYII